MQQTNGSQSFASLLERLSGDVATLVRQEVELARAELEEKARSAVAGVALVAIAAAAGLAAGAVLIAAVVLALATVMPAWLAALIVAAVLLTIAAPAWLAGVSRIKLATPIRPERTIEWVKEDVRWLSEQTRSAEKSS
jgi:cytochrome c biogenesis protein CcdA